VLRQERGFEFEGNQSAGKAQGLYGSADQADSDAQAAQKALQQMETDLTTTPSLVQVGNQTRENPEYTAKKQAIEAKRREYQSLRQTALNARREANAAAGASNARPSQQGGVRPAAQPPSRGVTLDGALRAFRARAKREPTAEEITNIKRHYGFQ
jgi:hypothetical protein